MQAKLVRNALIKLCNYAKTIKQNSPGEKEEEEWEEGRGWAWANCKLSCGSAGSGAEAKKLYE